MKRLSSTEIFNVKVTTENEDNILEYLVELLKNKGKKAFITTPNPEIIMYAANHPGYRKILNEADVALPDGVGVVVASYLLGKGKVRRITGVELMKRLCLELSKLASQGTKSPYSAGFFGGQTGIAELTSKCLQKKYSGLKVSYASDVWDESKIKGKNIDVLFVAMGHPKQEEWIYKNLPDIPVGIAMGVGGSFDFISGNVSRAPKWMRTFGLEWLYRLIRQPWRWKRQLSLISFSLRTFKEAFTSRFSR